MVDIPLAEQVARAPTASGVYVMREASGAVLYIGKAKNLRARLKQYFEGSDERWIIPHLLQKLHSIDTVVTRSEKEALLLENTLIKREQPYYNAKLKDDKSYISLSIDLSHPWPKLQLVRQKGKPQAKTLYFGPYPSAYAAKQTLELLQRLFPLRQCSDAELLRRERPCVLYGIKRCVAPCVGLVTQEAYQEIVNGVVDFLRGRRAELVELLRAQRDQASAALAFERAALLQETLDALDRTLQRQHVDRIQGGWNGDVLALYRHSREVMISLLHFQEGKLMGFAHHYFTDIADSDEELLEAFLWQSYSASSAPEQLLVPIPIESSALFEEEWGLSIQQPKSKERKELMEMAEQNAQAAFFQRKDEKVMREQLLNELQEKLHLERYPRTIECIDTSHLGGQETVAVTITFVDGEAEKKSYKTFRLHQDHRGDDYAALAEVLQRRFSKDKKNVLPDLLLIDGGKAHLERAQSELEALNIAVIDLASLAKEEGRHDRGMRLERVFLVDQVDPLSLSPKDPLLLFLQRVRDEAHRFALHYQKRRRSKAVTKSLLDEVEGIGPVKKQRLLTHFGSVERMAAAEDVQICQVPGIGAKECAALRKVLGKKRSLR